MLVFGLNVIMNNVQEKLVVTFELETVRLHAAMSCETRSVCARLRDEDVYRPSSLDCDSQDRHGRSRYNGHLVQIALQDLYSKFEKIKVTILHICSLIGIWLYSHATEFFTL